MLTFSIRFVLQILFLIMAFGKLFVAGFVIGVEIPSALISFGCCTAWFFATTVKISRLQINLGLKGINQHHLQRLEGAMKVLPIKCTIDALAIMAIVIVTLAGKENPKTVYDGFYACQIYRALSQLLIVLQVLTMKNSVEDAFSGVPDTDEKIQHIKITMEEMVKSSRVGAVTMGSALIVQVSVKPLHGHLTYFLPIFYLLMQLVISKTLKMFNVTSGRIASNGTGSSVQTQTSSMQSSTEEGP